MGTYIGQSDIEDVFGKSNVSRWANIDNTDDPTVATQSRITSAIAYAERLVEARLRDRQYAIPLTASSGSLDVIVDVCAKLAGAWLYESRGIDDEDAATATTARKKEADRMLNMILSGQVVLAASPNHNGPTAPIVV